MPELPKWQQAAQAHWRWRGLDRPPFADVPRPDQTSVWDFPRPPRLAEDAREILIYWGELEVARTRHAIRVLETGHPPSFYLPMGDVSRGLLRATPGTSFCEWKGPASYWSLVSASRTLTRVAWSYPTPMAGAEALAGCVAFYPTHLECRVGGAVVTPQPGGFYGGWVTPELAGPFKGEPGSESW